MRFNIIRFKVHAVTTLSSTSQTKNVDLLHLKLRQASYLQRLLMGDIHNLVRFELPITVFTLVTPAQPSFTDDYRKLPAPSVRPLLIVICNFRSSMRTFPEHVS